MAMSYHHVSVLLPEPSHNQIHRLLWKIHICNTQILANKHYKKKAVISALGFERSGPGFDSRRL